MVRNVEVDEVERLLEQGVLVIDVLSADSYRRVHIPGAKNVPVSAEDFAAQVARLAPDKHAPVVVYCSDPECQASPKAAHILEDHLGYKDVREFPGGLAAWRRSGRKFAGEGRKRLHDAPTGSTSRGGSR
jgi:rhodanese-related sulfurtransferase